MKAYIDLMSSLEARLASFAAKLAVGACGRPKTTILIFLSSCLACMSGLTQMKIVTDGRALWVDHQSSAFSDLEFVESTYEPVSRVNQLFITTKEKDGNILSRETLLEVFDVHEEILALQSTHGVRFEDVCLRTDPSAPCRMQSPLALWQNNKSIFEASCADDEDVSTYVRNALDNPSLQALKRTFGKLEMRDTVTAKAMVLTYSLMGSRNETPAMEWEEEFIKAGLETRTLLDVFVKAERSLDDELEKSVGGDIKLMVLAYTFMVVFASLTLGQACSPVKSRSGLATAEVFLILLATGGAYGLACFMGIPFTSLSQILPFILVGVGIDNAYVIVGAFDQTDSRQDVHARIAEAIHHAGMSITVTSLTDLFAFLLASFTALPAVQWFGQYACLSVLSIWLAHLTVFPTLLVLDTKRQDEGRIDVACCIKRGQEKKDASTSQSTSGLGTFFREYYGPFILHPVVKAFILAGFFSMTCLGAWQTTYLKTDFDLRDIAPDDSYMQATFDVGDEFFGSANANLPAALYVRDVDFEQVGVLSAINCTVHKLLDLPTVNSDLGKEDWLDAFQRWLLEYPQSSLAFKDGFFHGTNFTQVLKEWLSTADGKPFKRNLVFNEEGDHILSARIWVFHKSTNESKGYIEQFESTQALSANHKCGQVLDGNVFISAGEAYLFYHQFSIIIAETVSSIGLSLLAVFLICAVLLIHPLSILITILTLAMIFITLIGTLPGIWGLTLNSVSMVNLLMAIGLVVDFTAHIVHTFGLQAPHISKRDRVLSTLESIGPAVLLGVTTTFLGVVPLAWANSQVFRVFFKMFLSIVCIGGSFGLCFVPVLLSIIGPAVHRSGSSAKIVPQ